MKILQKICFVLLLTTFSSVYGMRYEVELEDGRKFEFDSQAGLSQYEATEVLKRHLLHVSEFEECDSECKERESLHNKKTKFLDDIIKRFQDGCRGKSGYGWRDCWPKYLPSKCRGLVYLDGNHPWQQCVISCATESVYSRTFGECSH